MTNREKILSNVGDNLVADQLIDCVQAYRTETSAVQVLYLLHERQAR